MNESNPSEFTQQSQDLAKAFKRANRIFYKNRTDDGEMRRLKANLEWAIDDARKNHARPFPPQTNFDEGAILVLCKKVLELYEKNKETDSSE